MVREAQRGTQGNEDLSVGSFVHSFICRSLGAVYGWSILISAPIPWVSFRALIISCNYISIFMIICHAGKL